GGIATGGGSFTLNQSANKTITVSAPATNITASLADTVLNISSSTGSGDNIDLDGIFDGSYLDRKDDGFSDFDTLIPSSGAEEEKFSVSSSGSVTHAPTSDSGYWNTFTFFGGQTGNQLTINNKDGHLWLKHWNSATASENWRRVAEIPDLFSGDYNDLSNKL